VVLPTQASLNGRRAASITEARAAMTCLGRSSSWLSDRGSRLRSLDDLTRVGSAGMDQVPVPDAVYRGRSTPS
jgi:hypothetical protein